MTGTQRCPSVAHLHSASLRVPGVLERCWVLPVIKRRVPLMSTEKMQEHVLTRRGQATQPGTPASLHFLPGAAYKRNDTIINMLHDPCDKALHLRPALPCPLTGSMGSNSSSPPILARPLPALASAALRAACLSAINSCRVFLGPLLAPPTSSSSAP